MLVPKTLPKFASNGKFVVRRTQSWSVAVILREDGAAIIQRLELATTADDLLEVQAPFAKLVERIKQAFDR